MVQIQNKFNRIVPHDALYQHFTNGSTPSIKGAARAGDEKCF